MMRYGSTSVLVLLLAACSFRVGKPSPPSDEGQPDPPEPTKVEVDLVNLGPAPELTNEVWLNTDHPLRLADLRGKVVLLDMWTFG